MQKKEYRTPINELRISKYKTEDRSSLYEYYRHNMPFEHGIDYGLRRFNSEYDDKIKRQAVISRIST